MLKLYNLSLSREIYSSLLSKLSKRVERPRFLILQKKDNVEPIFGNVYNGLLKGNKCILNKEV